MSDSLGASPPALDVTERVGELAAWLAERAAGVDAEASLSHEHLAAVADAGLYGAFAPVVRGGLGLDRFELAQVVEELAAACLATTFVWIQHFRLLSAALDGDSPPALTDSADAVIGGRMKGGVALGGALPGPVRLRASETARGWVLDGEAPWVSGWGLIDTLLVSARAADDTVVSALVVATQQPHLTVSAQRLAALDATATVALGFNGFPLAAAQVIGRRPFGSGVETADALRVNGSLALGVARRCCALLGPSPLDDDLITCRSALAEANDETVARARASASALAVRSAHALAVSRGSSSVRSGDVAERSTREASLLLSFASRPAIRDALSAIYQRERDAR